MLDKRTVKARLLRSEMGNVRHIFHELIQIRYRKLTKEAMATNNVPSDVLTAEEDKLLRGVLTLAEAYQTFAKNLFQGHLSTASFSGSQKSAVLRFLKEVPAIIGTDVKSYGPFKAEDVASLPIENAKVLVKQGLAERIEIH